MKLELFGSVCAFTILKMGDNYFIPGNQDDNANASEFNGFAIKYLTTFDMFPGMGWLFDKSGIDKVKRMLDNDEATYIEAEIKNVSIKGIF